MRKLILFCIAFIVLGNTYAQTLFNYGNNNVSKDEFLKVYQKNSINGKPDMSEKALREYLDLYSLFKMKVKEARIQRVDTMSSINYELTNYRKQLAKNYLTDEQMTEKLIKEVYDRMKEDVRVAHILVYSSQFVQSKDTVQPYNKIDSIYNAIIKGKADFAAMAEKYSDDPDSKKRGGDIGYFTSLQTVYQFENAAYTTPVGKVSKPFRTQFGYHIVKVLDRRPAVGQVQVAQVLVNIQKSKGDEAVQEAKKKIETALAELKAGANFEDVVKKYSEDKFSINEGGVLKAFGVGEMTPSFEKVAFGLKKPGDISEPVETEYGLHIIKLISKTPLQSYESLRTMIKKKVENDARSQTAKDLYIAKIKEQNGFKEFNDNYQELLNKISVLPDTGKTANTFMLNDFRNMNKTLFTFNKKEYTQFELMKFMDNLTRGRIMGVRSAVLKDVYNLYLNNIINDYQEYRLIEENAEFKAFMDDYADGIMLFELMDRNVWSKASKDTIGLKAFYETKKNKYMWEPGFSGAIYTFKNETTLKEAQKLFSKKDVKDEDFMKKLNTEENPDAVTVIHGRYEFSKYKDFPQSELIKGKFTKSKKNENGSYSVVRVDDVYNTPMPKSLIEAKGYIVAEYQDYLEKKWHEELRAKYPVKLDETVFKSMVK
ncbi:hypothetical protein CAP35_10225 [Chitinophagaceae bacterium IBVUCB1]|nr:hypothetical protein CAP35_10225 [Chitinophagaceae bacterium IBVUCB1]